VSNSSPTVEPHWQIPEFWRKVERITRNNLARLMVETDDADWIVGDMMRRCVDIRPELPVDQDSPVYRNFGALMCDMITAEQRLFAARNYHMPGRLLEDWPPTPLCFEHPFLVALQRVVSRIEVEANLAERGKGLN
jgi:hypothetical protein